MTRRSRVVGSSGLASAVYRRRMAIGIDIGGTSMRIAAVRGDAPAGEITRVPTPARLEDVVPVLAGLLDGISEPVGVGCAGVVDAAQGIWRWMPHRPGGPVAIRSELEEALGVPVVVDNDVNMALGAELAAGAAAGEATAVMVALGTGIGGALAVDGRVVHGRGAMGEVGHMRVADGPLCACGASGCWEAVVSGRVLDAVAASLLGPESAAPELFAAAEADHPAAIGAVEGAATWLGIGLANLAVIFDPEVIVVGGAAAHPRLVAGARAHLATTPGVLAVTGAPPVHGSTFGSLAGLVGAAMAAEEMVR